MRRYQGRKATDQRQTGPWCKRSRRVQIDSVEIDRLADPTHETISDIAQLDLYWIPLGAGQTVVRISGKVFESIVALMQRRRPLDLFHSALVITMPEGSVAIEMAPVSDRQGGHRGVVSEGAVGMKWLGRFRIFRYEIRRWRNGIIPDVRFAHSATSIDVTVACAQHLFDLVPSVPTPVWGRDEFGVGDMWNSNSVVSWLLAQEDAIDINHLQPPPGGRAPGWTAGLAVAARHRASL